MYGLNYPEILKCCYIINGKIFFKPKISKSNLFYLSAPKVFAFAFNIVKKVSRIYKFLHRTTNLKQTLSKVLGRVHDWENSHLQVRQKKVVASDFGTS